MKKLLPLFCIAVLFFSCKTTGAAVGLEDQIAAEVENALEEPSEMPKEEEAAQEESDSQEEEASVEENSSQENPVEENPVEENPVEETEEKAPIEELVISEIPEEKVESEKIPQNEIDEMYSLLKEDSSGNQQSEENTAVTVAPQTEQSDNSQLVASIPENNAQISANKPSVDNAQSTPVASNNAPSSNAQTSANKPSVDNAQSTPATSNNAPSSNATSSNISDSYDFTNSDGDSEDEPEELPVPIVPSRTMTVKNNQFVDIVYPGMGWIYLGETGGGDHFIFQGRKLGKNETTFSLRSKKPGSAVLHFYKNDALTGKYIDDYIQITVGEQGATDAAHVKAPAYAEIVPQRYDPKKSKAQNDLNTAQEEKENALAQSSKKSEPQQEVPQAQTLVPSANEPNAKESMPAENVQTVIQTFGGQDKNEGGKKTSVAGAPSNNAPSSAKEGDKKTASSENAQGGTSLSLLEQAQKAYDEKRYAEALDLIHQFFEVATKDFDAGLYLQGLILEAKSEVQNIKAAIDAYDTLMKNWPQSRFWRRASERSIYLKRFYIDIR